MQYVDRVGQAVEQGCKVAFGTRKGNVGKVRTAVVTEVVKPKRGSHYYLLTTDAGRVTAKYPDEVVRYA